MPWALTRYLKWWKPPAQRRWDKLSALFVAKMANVLPYAIRINTRTLQMKPASLATHSVEVAMSQVRPLLELSIIPLLSRAHSALELQVCQLSTALRWATVLANLGSTMTLLQWIVKLVTPDAPNATGHPIRNAWHAPQARFSILRQIASTIAKILLLSEMVNMVTSMQWRALEVQLINLLCALSAIPIALNVRVLLSLHAKNVRTVSSCREPLASIIALTTNSPIWSTNSAHHAPLNALSAPLLQIPPALSVILELSILLV